jgi:hypothetical protein
MNCLLPPPKAMALKNSLGKPLFLEVGIFMPFCSKNRQIFLPPKQLQALRKGDIHGEITVSRMQYHLYQPDGI